MVCTYLRLRCQHAQTCAKCGSADTVALALSETAYQSITGLVHLQLLSSSTGWQEMQHTLPRQSQRRMDPFHDEFQKSVSLS